MVFEKSLKKCEIADQMENVEYGIGLKKLSFLNLITIKDIILSVDDNNYAI